MNNFFCIILRLWGEKEKFEQHYKSYVFVNSIAIIFPIIISLFIMSFKGGKSEYRIFPNLFISFCMAVVILRNVIKDKKEVCAYKYWKYALGFNFQLIPHYMAITLMAQIDRIMIDKMCGRADVAVYSLAYAIGNTGTMVISSMVVAITPWIYMKFKKNNGEGIGTKIYNSAKIIAYLIIVMSIFAEELVIYMGTSEYMEAKSCIPIILAGCYMYFFVCMFQLPLFYYDKKTGIIISSCSALGLNFILNLVGINLYGYKAASYTTLVCYIIQCVGSYVFFLKFCKNENNEIKKCCIPSMFIICLCILFSSLEISIVWKCVMGAIAGLVIAKIK